MEKRSRQLTICVGLLLVSLLFIWGNSLLPGPKSSEISGGFMKFLTEMIGKAIPGGEFLIRKLAHFSEFACLGLLLGWLSLLMKQHGVHLFTMPLLCGMMAALLDETIQVLTPARGPSVVDVWIDTAGAAFGILILLMGHSIFCHRRKQLSDGGK